jgi:copper(I)-binding protein
MRHWISGCVLLGFVALAACAERTERTPVATAGDLSIYDAYAPASAAPDVGSLYFTVVNGGEVEDTLIQIRVVEGRAELHDVVTEAGLTRMQHVPALTIPAGGTVRLGPGSYHVMLTGLSAPLEVGQTVPVALLFAHGGIARFAAPVLTYSDVVERLEATAER